MVRLAPGPFVDVGLGFGVEMGRGGGVVPASPASVIGQGDGGC